MQRTARTLPQCSGAAAAPVRPVFRQSLAAPLLRSEQAGSRAARRATGRIAAVAETKAASKPAAGAGKEDEFYEVYLTKPIGVKFGRGNDSGAYVNLTNPALGSTDPRITPGDKVVKVSASFGGDVWEALNFGQVVYAIKTRSGEVYLKLQRNYGDLSMFEEEELTDAEKQYKAERGSGNYGLGSKEMQQRNYIARKEAERARRELFDDALTQFRAGKIEAALIEFENVLSLEPRNYLGDDFSRVTQVFRVTQYNIACCYSMLEQETPGLEALDSAMASGFENFEKVRKDPNLAFLRKSKRFTKLINRYDEPLINEGAVKALKSLFSFGRKSDDDDEE